MKKIISWVLFSLKLSKKVKINKQYKKNEIIR